MAIRRQPLPKRFPGQVVAQIKIWFGGWTCGMEGPIAPELGRLIVAVFTNERDPAVMTQLDAIAADLRDRPKKVPSEAELRRKVSKARKSGKLGAK